MRTLLAVLALLLLAGCQGNSYERPETTPEKTGEAAAKPAGPVTEVTVSGNDQMQFDKKEIRIKAGVRVKLTLKHTGKAPAATMGHNLVLLKAGTDVAKFATRAAAAKSTAFIPASEKDSVIAHTRILGGGESDTIEFDAPAAGTYDYVCTFPGHYVIMRGKLIVE